MDATVIRDSALRSNRVAMSTVLILCLFGSACSGGADPSSPQAEGSDAPTTTTTVLSGERFGGTNVEFYVPPDPLPAGEPGDVIRTMDLGEADGYTNVLVMYHSRNAEDRDMAVTGLISYPTAPSPDGGWPVVATAPGTTGVAARCAISHQHSDAPSWGVDGVRVLTDYIGLGVVGGPLHPYLSRPSEGHSLIDAVRAARNLSETGAGDRWLAVGHSQGGHGALSAHELAGSYAPELDLVGTLAIAPASMLDEVYGGIDPIVTGILTAMSLYGAAGEHPEIDVADYVSAELADAAEVMETGCLDEITAELVPLAIGGNLFTADPRSTEPARSLLLTNEVGDVAVDAPLFLVSGTADDRVVIDRVRDLFDRLCAAGQVTELLIVDGADHGSIISQTAQRTSEWLEARLADQPPTDACSAQP